MSEGRLVEVYRAKDSPQAHILRSALEDAGIRALIEGDLLQGAVGEIPAGWPCAPRIMVEEGDATHARALLERWERSRPVEVPGLAGKSLAARVNKVRELVHSLGPAVAFRKLHGILNALEMQVEDGKYQHHAVARLCEALLATAELYDIPEGRAGPLKEAASAVVALVEDRR